LPRDWLDRNDYSRLESWVVFRGTDDKTRRELQSQFQSDTLYYITWKGELSGPGAYGHMSVYLYQFVVHEIVEKEKIRSLDVWEMDENSFKCEQ